MASKRSRNAPCTQCVANTVFYNSLRTAKEFVVPPVLCSDDEEEDEEIEWESEDGGTVARRDGGTVRAKASDVLPPAKGEERGGPTGAPRKGEGRGRLGPFLRHAMCPLSQE